MFTIIVVVVIAPSDKKKKKSPKTQHAIPLALFYSMSIDMEYCRPYYYYYLVSAFFFALLLLLLFGRRSFGIDVVEEPKVFVIYLLWIEVVEGGSPHITHIFPHVVLCSALPLFARVSSHLIGWNQKTDA